MNKINETEVKSIENIYQTNDSSIDSNSTSNNQKENKMSKNENEKSDLIKQMIERIRNENGDWISDKNLYNDAKSVIDKASNESGLKELDANDLSTLIDKYFTEISYVTNWHSGLEAKHWINLRKIANITKVIVQGRGEDWTQFAKNHIDSPLRSLQRYMRIAQYDGVEELAYLGIERLTILVNEMSSLEDYNSLPNFVESYKLDNFDLHKDRYSSAAKYKVEVQKAMLKHISERNKWSISSEMIEKCIKNNDGHVDIKQIVKDTSIAIESGGSAEKYFELISEDKGKNKKVIKDFQKALEELKKMAISIKSNGEFRKNVGTSKITPVIEALVKLKTNIEDDLKAQA